MNIEELNHSLEMKKNILERIFLNTETQFRFLQKGQMKGLFRLLNEREKFLGELAIVNEALEIKENWNTVFELQPLIQLIAEKETRIKEVNDRLLNQAVIEKDNLLKKLQRVREHQQWRKLYGKQTGIKSGMKIDKKG